MDKLQEKITPCCKSDYTFIDASNVYDRRVTCDKCGKQLLEEELEDE